MAATPEMEDFFDDDSSSWAIPLNEPDVIPPSPVTAPSLDGVSPAVILPFRLDELPTEGFTPRLRRFDEAS